MIDTLTEAQWASMYAHREEMYAVGSACGASDRPAVREVLTAMYAAIGMPPPVVVFTRSPLSVLLATQIGSHTVSQRGRQLKDQTRDQTRDQLDGQIRDPLRDELREKLRGHIEPQLRGQLVGQIQSQLWNKLWISLGAQLWDQIAIAIELMSPIKGQLGCQLGGHLGNFFYGNHEAYWIAYYSFMPQIGVQYPPALVQQLGWWETLARSCGWWLPYTKVCFVADRPIEQHVDGQRRLHCATGPAMRFADDYALWSWHGVRVSRQVIETPETLTLTQIQQEANVEIQRIMVERYGWERYLEATQSTLLDSDVDSSGRGTLRGLYRTTIGARQAAILVCTCDSTGKTFPLEVPPEVTTCRQAAGWLAQDDDLRLLVQS